MTRAPSPVAALEPVVHIRQVRMPTIPSRAPGGVKYGPGRWYYVELHLPEFGLYGPAALGVVHATGGRRGRRVDFHHLEVCDVARKQGHGTRVVQAIRARWPNAVWCDTCESRPFHAALVRDGVARVTSHGTSAWFYTFA